MASVQLTWNLPANSPDPIAYFRVERDTVTGRVVVADNLTPLTDLVVLSDQPVGPQDYFVISVSEDGDEAEATVTVEVTDILPAPVTNLQGTSL